MREDAVNRIKETMERRHMGPSEVARHGGPSRPTVYRILTEPNYEPELTTLHKLANSLGTTTEHLLTGEGQMEGASLSAHGSSSSKGTAELTTGPSPLPGLKEGTPTQKVVLTAIWSKLKGKTDEEIQQWYEDHEEYDSKKEGQ